MNQNTRYFIRRRQLRFTQGEVARELGCATVSVSMFERGERELPYGLSTDDYEAALARLIEQRRQAEAVA